MKISSACERIGPPRVLIGVSRSLFYFILFFPPTPRWSMSSRHFFEEEIERNGRLESRLVLNEIEASRDRMDAGEYGRETRTISMEFSRETADLYSCIPRSDPTSRLLYWSSFNRIAFPSAASKLNVPS